MEAKQQIQTCFKMNGLQLRLEACKYLVSVLQPIATSHQEREQWIDKIIEHIQKQQLKSSVIDKSILVTAIKSCSAEDAGNENINTVNVINSFSTPRLTYCVERKKYLTDAQSGRDPPQLLSSPGSKTTIYLDRYTMLQQRTARHDLFNSADANPGAVKKKFQLKTVEFLHSTTAKLDDVIVLGMMTQVSHGTYHLEDPTGVVKLDLSQAKFHHGLFCENCFVLAEGWYEDEIFHVLAMGFPPAEAAATTRAYFGNVNFFGGPTETSAAMNERLAEVELDANRADDMFVILSDVWLDKVEVVDRLRRLFAGYSSVPPTAFILLGNFLSQPPGSATAYCALLAEHFRQLADMVAEHPTLVEQSRFFFVPGPTDPGSPNIFPRPPLPQYVTKDISSRLPLARFLTNPARIQYCTQEIVVFREDILTKLARNAIYYPESGNIADHFCKTITSQGHLTPLPLHTCPVYWDHDRALQLYPLPDLVVSGDKCEAFSAENLGCKVINPGSFVKTDFSFKTYVPSTRTVEESQVPAED
jgi:DNA polymerase epsilon subunit 2